MGKIVILDNPLDTTQRREFVHTGPLIDWLEQHYPHGFDRPHVTAFNTQQLRVADYDREVGDNDLVVIGLAPGLEAIGVALVEAFGAYAVASAIESVVMATISFALSYIANSIFGRQAGSKSAGRSLPDPSPTYSLSVPTNTARLGQPIPVIYGNVVATPDLATAPYTWYDNNEMYAGILLCLGQGWHQINELRVAATPAQQIAAGTLTWRAFAPDEHNQTFGVIQTAMGFWENVYTSPEVADQELQNTDPHGSIVSACQWSIEHRIDCDNYYRIDAYVPTVQCDPQGTCTPLNCEGQMPPLPALLPACLALGQTVTITVGGATSTHTVSNYGQTGTSAWLVTTPPPPCVGTSYRVDQVVFLAPPLFNNNTLTVRLHDAAWTSLPVIFTDTGADLTFTGPFSTAILDIFTGTVTGALQSASYDVVAGTGYVTLVLSDFVITTSIEETLIRCDDPEDTDTCRPYQDVRLDITPTAPRIDFACLGAGGGGMGGGAFEVGPYVATPPGWATSWLQVDVVFPGGLFVARDDGTLGWEGCGLVFTAYRINDAGAYLGQFYQLWHTFWANENTPKRWTLNWPVPSGRYAVSARRNTAKSPRAIDQSNVLWTGLKAVLDNKGRPAYGETTLIAIKAKASNGLATDALNRFAVNCTRRLPDYLDADSDGDLTELRATYSHARAFADIYVNPKYGAGRPLTEVEWAALATLEDRTWAPPGSYGFNGIFDQQVSVWEALSLAVAPVSAFPATNGALLTVVEDIARATATHAFNASNIVQDSFQLSYKFNDLGTADGVEIEYRDPVTFQQAFYTWPPLAQYAEKLVLFGCTCASQAQAYARRIWRQRLYRREFVSFATELEGHLPLIGELISLDHPLLAAPTCYVVGSVTPGDDYKVTLEGHRYVPAVYVDEDA